jgi:hypothetical protein
MNDWIADYARELAGDPLPEDAERMAQALLIESRRGNLEAERALCAVRLNRKGKEPIKAIEHWLDYAMALRAAGRHEDWDVCMQPDRHGSKITPKRVKRETTRWFDSREIIRAVDRAHAAGHPKSKDRPTKTNTPTAFEVACEALKAEFGPRMPNGWILTPEAVRMIWRRKRPATTNSGERQRSKKRH